MSFNSSLSGPVHTALRYGLVDIEPFEISKIVKKFGLRFRVTERGFRPSTPSKDFEELVFAKYSNLFQTIEVPEIFDVDVLVEVISKAHVKAYERDEEIKKAIEEIRDAQRKCRPLLNFIRLLRRRRESAFSRGLRRYASRFLKSNFPLSFFTKLATFDSLIIDFLQIMEGIVRIYEFKASAARNFQRYQRIIKEMQRKLIPIIDELDLCDLAYLRLKWYVYLWNSEDYEDIFEPKFLDLNRVDLFEFQDLLRIYEEQLMSSRRVLWRYYKDPMLVSLCRKEIAIKGEAKSIFANLLVFPSLEI